MNFREFLESIKILPDEKIDQELKNKDVMTFDYNIEAANDFGKVTNVLVSKDMKYMHIPRPTKDPVVIKKTQEKIKKYNLKEIE